jgi:antitoxin VapB
MWDIEISPRVHKNALVLTGAGPKVANAAQLANSRGLAYVQAYAMGWTMQHGRRVKLFRNGRNQAVRIPVEFEIPGDEAVIHREGDRLVIEPVQKRSLLAVLSTLARLDEDFPDIDEGLMPLRNVTL